MSVPLPHAALTTRSVPWESHHSAASPITTCQSHPSLRVPLQPACTIATGQSHPSLIVPLQPASFTTACQSHYNLPVPSTIAYHHNQSVLLPHATLTIHSLPVPPQHARPMTTCQFNDTTCESHHKLSVPSEPAGRITHIAPVDPKLNWNVKSKYS